MKPVSLMVIEAVVPSIDTGHNRHCPMTAVMKQGRETITANQIAGLDELLRCGFGQTNRFFILLNEAESVLLGVSVSSRSTVKPNPGFREILIWGSLNLMNDLKLINYSLL